MHNIGHIFAHALGRKVSLALTLGVLATTGCYERPEPECAFQCGMEEGAEGACPDGYTCNAAFFCVRDDVDPRIDCLTGEIPPDAGASIDAAVDAAVQ